MAIYHSLSFSVVVCESSRPVPTPDAQEHMDTAAHIHSNNRPLSRTQADLATAFPLSYKQGFRISYHAGFALTQSHTYRHWPVLTAI